MAPVEAETLDLGGQQIVVHEIVLTDTTGDGPELCDRFRPADSAATDDATSGGGGCTPRVETADDDATAVRLAVRHDGTERPQPRARRSGPPGREGQDLGHDGGETLARLHLTGWEGTKMLTVTAVGAESPPQRLVAYGRDEQVLESVDLRESLGEDENAGGSTCGNSLPNQPPPTQTAVGIEVSAGPDEALVLPTDEGIGSGEQCLPLTSTIQGVTAGPDAVVLVVAPEVASVSVRDRSQTETGTDPVADVPRRLPGSIWRYVVVQAPDGEGALGPQRRAGRVRRGRKRPRLRARGVGLT